MKIMNCPLNGPRNISEFVHGGEVRQMPDPNTCSDMEWADYVFYSDNAIGIVTEWWLHAPSGYWFIAERHTASGCACLLCLYVLETNNQGSWLSIRILVAKIHSLGSRYMYWEPRVIMLGSIGSKVMYM